MKRICKIRAGDVGVNLIFNNRWSFCTYLSLLFVAVTCSNQSADQTLETGKQSIVQIYAISPALPSHLNNLVDSFISDALACDQLASLFNCKMSHACLAFPMEQQFKICLVDKYCTDAFFQANVDQAYTQGSTLSRKPHIYRQIYHLSNNMINYLF